MEEDDVRVIYGRSAGLWDNKGPLWPKGTRGEWRFKVEVCASLAFHPSVALCT